MARSHQFNAIILAMFLWLSGCAMFGDDQLKQGDIRLQGLKESAMTFGAQNAVAWRYKIILALLKSNSDALYRVYRFQDLLLKNNVLPPVIQISWNTANINQHNALRLSGQDISIIKPARLVTTVPSWLDYVYVFDKKDWQSSTYILPKNAEERAIWDQYVIQGWDKGIEQASVMFAINFSRLNRDFIGMLTYHHLLAQHMISPTFTAKSTIGITGSGSHMRINDRIVRITSHSALLPQASKQWSPALIQQ